MGRKVVAVEADEPEEEVQVVEIDKSKMLAMATTIAGGSIINNESSFYMPSTVNSTLKALGIVPDKLIVPREYHEVIMLCYEFYKRGGIVGTVLNRLSELSLTSISNGQRSTTNEANTYFDAVLHRAPSRLNRYLRTAVLEYYISGMVLPKVDWKEVEGKDLHPNLRANKIYTVPVVDSYPPKLVKVEWAGWGAKEYYIKIPDSDIRLIRRGKNNKVKEQLLKFEYWERNFPELVTSVQKGNDVVKIETDAILRKETSDSPYPTPYLYPVLEALIYKQQLRKMDYAVASRVINAILLITEGNDKFPITEDNRAGLDAIKAQIQFFNNHPGASQRIFPLFSNHTTKLQWIAPDVEAMLNQEKYQQVNEEIMEGLGLTKLLITGESRNGQASEVSTWAIQPMMEELRDNLLEWMAPIYEEAADLNGFRKIPVPTFAPIRLQDFIKTAAVFAQAFKEGNISRTTRDLMLGISFESETELMNDELELIKELTSEEFPIMPYDVVTKNTVSTGGELGRPTTAPNSGGRPLGSQNPAVNKRNRGVKPGGQSPVSRVAAEVSPMTDEEFIDAVTEIMAEQGRVITLADILPGNE